MHTHLPINGATIRTAATAAIVAVLSACSGDDRTTTATTLENPEQTVRTVARSISSNMGVNMDSVTGTADKSSAVTSVLTQTSDDNMDTDSSEVVFGAANTASALALLMSDDSSAASEDIVHDMLLPTLGIGGNSQISGVETTTGTVITIDPDEASVCTEWFGTTSSSYTDCTQLLSNLTVKVNAHNSESGTVTYLFSGQPVLTIQYAPIQGSYEFSLVGMKTVLQQLASLSGDETMVPEVMQGAVKVSATVVNDSPGAEAGSFSIAVTQPIRVEQPGENALLALAASELISMSADASSGTASLAVAVRGLEYAAQQFDGFTTSVMSMNLPAFTASATLSDEGDSLMLSELGMGNGPLTVAVDGTQVMQLALPQFAAMLNGATGTIDILETLSLDLNISDLASLDAAYADNSSAQIIINAPADTRMQDQGNDITLIESGGPIVFDYNISDGINNPNSTISVGAGQCFHPVEEGDYDLMAIAPCP